MSAIPSSGQCPFHAGGARSTQGAQSNADRWPDQLNLAILHQHQPISNPMDPGFNYAKAFGKIDYKALKQDLADLMKKQGPTAVVVGIVLLVVALAVMQRIGTRALRAAGLQ
jgi:catalase (peroxidase I)